ncbi:MAG: glycosyltransferase [Chitinophagaceae bacterium]|nr:MAG: glycosyltransferase [Chitinophagaceae bacterium]
MKLLSLVWFKVLPARFGGQKGTALFNRYLAEQAELVCLCSSDNHPDGPLPYRVRAELPPGKRSVFRPSVWRQIARVIAEEQPTHLLLEYPYHAYAAFRAARRHRIKLVLHEHNIEYRRFRNLGHSGWRLLRAYERWACRQADLVLFKTEEDRDHAVTVFGIDAGKTLLVPYGIEPGTPLTNDVDIREQWKIPDDALLLLFAGTLDYTPNADAVTAIYKELAPRLDAAGRPYRVLICGRNHSEAFQYLEALHHPCIQQTGEVENIGPYYAAADVFINPVLSGGGVQTKVVDALAAGCAVCTFEHGAMGIERSICSDKLIVVENREWDAMCQRVQRTPPGKEVPEAFTSFYSWPAIVARVATRLKELIHE